MRGAVWQKAVKQFVVPQLPGSWKARTGELIMEPVGHIACAVGRRNSSFGPSYHLVAYVEPLYVAKTGWGGMLERNLGRQGAGVSLPGFDNIEQGQQSMPTVLDLVRQEALPYLQRYGNPEGFLDLCRQRNREHPAGGHYEILRQQAATEALLGDNHAALESIDQLIRVMAKLMTESPLPWMSEVLTDAQALRAQLTGNSAAVQPSLAQIEAQRRSALKLPPPSKPQQGG